MRSRKRRIRIYFRRDSLKIPIYDKQGKKGMLSLNDIIDTKRIAKDLNVEVVTRKCPLDHICQKFCKMNPDMIFLDETTGRCLIIRLQDIESLKGQLNGCPAEKRNFSVAINRKIRKDFFEKIARN